MQKNSFMTFSLFNDVEDPTLQGYNRFQVIRNLIELDKNEVAKGYLSQFSKRDKFNIVAIMSAIQLRGEEEFKAELIRTTQFDDGAYESAVHTDDDTPNPEVTKNLQQLSDENAYA